MNINDPFADDLNSLDAIMAQLAAEQSRQSQNTSNEIPSRTQTQQIQQSNNFPTTLLSSSTTTTTTGLQNSPQMIGLEGRRGRRDVILPRDSEQKTLISPPSAISQQQSTETKTTTTTIIQRKEQKKGKMPWESDDDDDDDNSNNDNNKNKKNNNKTSNPSLGIHTQVSRNLRSAVPAFLESESDPNSIVLKDHLEGGDPLDFLEGTISAKRIHSGVADITIPSSNIPKVEDEEMQRRLERRELLSSLDAVEMELEQIKNTLDTLQINADTELTELEAKIIEKQTELSKGEDSIINEEKTYNAYHQKRIMELHNRTSILLKEQEDELRTIENGKYEAQLRAINTSVTDIENRIKKLQEQRDLLLLQHRYDEKGILLSLAKEEEEEKENYSSIHNKSNESNSDTTTNNNNNNNNNNSVESKMNAALRILRQYQEDRLNSLTDGVVKFLHQETMEVSQEVRHQHEVAYMQDIITRKTELSNFLQEMLQRYREFFHQRATQKTQYITKVREGLQKSTTQLQEQAKERLEARMQEVTVKLQVAAQRFEKLATESMEVTQRKAAALIESDNIISRQQYTEAIHRYEAEQAMLERLHDSELETLQKQLERLREWDGKGYESRQLKEILGEEIQESTQTKCTTRVNSIMNTVRELEGVVQQQLRKQVARNKALRGEGENHLFLTDEEITAHMAVQEREVAVTTLLEEANKRQSELANTRHRCNELRTYVADKLEEEIQTVRQQRLSQESHLASIELVRLAWEREVRELLHWGHDTLLDGNWNTIPLLGEISEGISRTHIPAATAAADIVNIIVERNRNIIEDIVKLRNQRNEMQNIIIKEHKELITEREITEKRWVQLLEQMLHLLSEQESAAKREIAVSNEIAKIEAAKELIEHDKDIFLKRRDELNETATRLKNELQEILECKANYTAELEKLTKEQTALAQEQHRLAIEQYRLESTRINNILPQTPSKQVLHNNSSPKNKITVLHNSINKLQDETGSENVPVSLRKEQKIKHEEEMDESKNDDYNEGRQRRKRRSTLPPSRAPPSPSTSVYHVSPFIDFVAELDSAAS